MVVGGLGWQGVSSRGDSGGEAVGLTRGWSTEDGVGRVLRVWGALPAVPRQRGEAGRCERAAQGRGLLSDSVALSS